MPDVALHLWKSNAQIDNFISHFVGLLKLRIDVQDIMVFHRLASAFIKQINPMVKCIVLMHFMFTFPGM